MKVDSELSRETRALVGEGTGETEKGGDYGEEHGQSTLYTLR